MHARPNEPNDSTTHEHRWTALTPAPADRGTPRPSATVTVDRYQLHRVVNGQEEVPAGWTVCAHVWPGERDMSACYLPSGHAGLHVDALGFGDDACDFDRDDRGWTDCPACGGRTPEATPETYPAPNPIVSAIGRFATAYSTDLDDTTVGWSVAVVGDVCDAGRHAYIHDLRGPIALRDHGADTFPALRLGTMVVVGGTVLEPGSLGWAVPALDPFLVMSWDEAVAGGPAAFGQRFEFGRRLALR